MNASIRSRFLALLACVAALALPLALSACGDDSTDVGELGPDPATMAPADAPFYAEAVVRPEGDMLENFNSTIGKISGTEDPGALITASIDEQLAEDGLSYSEDIEPWLGQRAGGFVTNFDATTEEADGAVAIAVSDTDAAQSFIDDNDDGAEELSYNDASYLLDEETAVGLSGDFLVIGTEQGFKDAVDAGAGDSLADNSDATSTLDEVPEDSLFSAYVDTQAAIDLVEASGGLSPAQLQQFEDQVAQYSEGPIDFWGTVGDDTITLAGSAPAPTDAPEPSDLVAGFPSGSWLAFAAADVGAQLATALDQFEQGFQAGLESAGVEGLDPTTVPNPLDAFQEAVGINIRTELASIGDVGGFVEGTSILGIGAGLVIETSDEQGATELVAKLQKALLRERSISITKTAAGFDITVTGAPVGAQVAVEDGKVVFAAGSDTVDDVLSPDETLDGSDRFNTAKDALGDDVTPSFYLDFLPILQLVESTGQTTDPEYQAAKPYLDALDFLAAGSKLDGERAIGSIVLGVREPDSDDGDAAAATLIP